jgi:uncharacterized protein (DUF302 family)
MTKRSRFPYDETVARLSQAVRDAGSTIFATLDQAAVAASIGLTLRPTTLIVFGNPKAGTPLMDGCPPFGLELPLKLLVWEQDGRVQIAYPSMAARAREYGVRAGDPHIAALDHALDTLSTSVT